MFDTFYTDYSPEKLKEICEKAGLKGAELRIHSLNDKIGNTGMKKDFTRATTLSP